MKFAKELQDQLVPEWQAKYLNYKARLIPSSASLHDANSSHQQLGKKKVKAIAKALRALETTSFPSSTLPALNHTPRSLYPDTPSQSNISSRQTSQQQQQQQQERQPQDQSLGVGPFEDTLSHLPIGIPERTPLCSPATNPRPGSYGSIIASPPDEHDEALENLQLPDPAMTPKSLGTPKEWNSPSCPSSAEMRRSSVSNVEGSDKDLRREGAQGSGNGGSRESGARGMLSTWTPNFRGTPGRDSMRRASINRLQRVFSHADRGQSASNDTSTPEAYKEFEARELDFVSFLDSELAKIEEFYKQKEAEFTERLHSLREQLHLLRDMRMDELRRKRSSATKPLRIAEEDGLTADASGEQKKDATWKKKLIPHHLRGQSSFIAATPAQLRSASVSSARDTAQHPFEQRQQRRDFAQRVEQDIPYRTAKRRLKMALIEYYRGLELLKSYVELNHKAFRKINKKYDKVTHARPALRYLTENVNHAWFVQSEVLDAFIGTVEDLYSRYFEKGNRKVAVGKLRGKLHRTEDYSPSSFRNGFMFAAGFVLGIQGVVLAGKHLFHPDPVVRVQTSYLLQLYAGYLLILFHFLLFCLDCRVWTRTKINYVFVFEYDTRNVLDWRQLSELPCFFTLLLGLIVFLNFRWVNLSIYIYWPVILIGLTVIILFLPFPVIYPRARKWWAYSNWRLLLPGLYPVEFRDFFLGDMYCSQTYALGNVALFFCLYGHKFHNAPQCNSSHSRAMGFMSTVPALIRGFQCLRRYIDTKNVFPHLVNLGKYTSTLLFYVMLSVYRIDRVYDIRAVFITFAVINALYSSTWDLAMDWSLCNIYSKNWGLRDSLAFRRKWVYYGAMVLDPILRFNWIFYIIFPRDFQHSALLSFFVAFSEVIRRGIWVIFRVENEHCTNVELFRASRDIPLPYEIPTERPTTAQQAAMSQEERIQRATGNAPAKGEGRQAERPPLTLSQLEQGNSIKRTSAVSPHFNPMHDVEGSMSQHRRHEQRSSISRMGSILARAHTQDFQRRVPAGDSPVVNDGSLSSSEDEEEEQEQEHALDESERRRAERNSELGGCANRGEGGGRGVSSQAAADGHTHGGESHQQADDL